MATDKDIAAAADCRAALNPGDRAPLREFRTIHGDTVALAAQSLPVHIQFRRFAGCPVCSLHLLTFVRRHDEVSRAVREVVLFHSPADALLCHAAGLPFAVVADPQRAVYRAFGVESGRRALLDPRAWPAIVRGVALAAKDVALGRRPMPPARPAEGNLGLPADFLVASDGTILARRYGRHAADQWSVDEVLRLAARHA